MSRQSKLWMRDSTGKRSATITIVWISFIVTTLAYLASIFDVVGPVKFRTFDIGACSTYFIPILSLYFGRRYTKAKFPDSGPEIPEETAKLLNE